MIHSKSSNITLLILRELSIMVCARPAFAGINPEFSPNEYLYPSYYLVARKSRQVQSHCSPLLLLKWVPSPRCPLRATLAKSPIMQGPFVITSISKINPDSKRNVSIEYIAIHKRCSQTYFEYRWASNKMVTLFLKHLCLILCHSFGVCKVVDFDDIIATAFGSLWF